MTDPFIVGPLDGAASSVLQRPPVRWRRSAMDDGAQDAPVAA
ncbi:MAG: hypothetical protein R2712_06250 [Vicinamibacterales bacterium]